ANLGKVRLFRQITVAGMDGVDAREQRGAHDVRDVQVALRGGGRPDAISFVGQQDVQRLAIRLRVDGDGPDPQLPAGANDAHRDLASVGDQDLLKQGLSLRQGSQLLNDKQRLAVLDRLRVFHENLFDPAPRLGLDLVHELHGLDNAKRLADFDDVAHFDVRLRIGSGGAVKGADHGRRDLYEVVRLRRLGGRRRGVRRGRRLSRREHRRSLRGRNGLRHALFDLDLEFRGFQLKLNDVRVGQHVDELLYLLQIQRGFLLGSPPSYLTSLTRSRQR